MKYVATIIIYLFIILLIAAGLSPLLLPGAPAPAPAAEYPNVVMEVMDPTLEPFAPLWRAEIDRRFHGAVGVLCHGGDFVSGQWITSSKSYGHMTTAAEVAEHFKRLYPTRTIVLLACNTGHVHLNVPGVYYAHSAVWCVPDRDMHPDDAGDALTLGPATKPSLPMFVFVPVRPPPTRWEAHPDYVGNIFEFITDQGK